MVVLLQSPVAPPAPPGVAQDAERAAREALRHQISRLERDLGETLVSVFPFATVSARDTQVPAPARGPRRLGLAELEVLRDDLAGQLRVARARLAERSAGQQQARELLEAMLLAPGKHKFVRLSNAALGEGGCGVWTVRPRLGLIGMLMGWWQVKLSSGCPLAAFS